MECDQRTFIADFIKSNDQPALAVTNNSCPDGDEDAI
jgi:hypothetical protein